MRFPLAVLLLLIAAPAAAGVCRNQNAGGESITVCDNGFVEIRDQRGSRSYGIRNGGFDRYPRRPVPPYAIERRDRD
ncbi:hypothetical protein WOC76_12615 [Methylocystis sp. IM3]|uniref:hypothetical protein n=1 Tax=unclassified Methylocystis TaxID=2625913 RepID=UPI0030F60E65